MPVRRLSAGALITDGRALLLGHSTGNPQWDIPKGRVEPGESPLAACLREVREETGLALDGLPIRDLGRRPYTRDKDLHLFRVDVEVLPLLESLICTSTFVDRRTGLCRPELDQFRHVALAEVVRYATPTMAGVIREALRG